MLEGGDAARRLVEAGVGPEIYLSGSTLDRLAPGSVEAVADALRASGIATATFHAPFNDINPGARDEEARRLAARRLRQAVVAAAPFRPLGIVMHGGYSDWLYDFNPDEWLAGAVRTFSETAEIAERSGVDLFVENVFDDVPDHLLRLLSAVGSKRMGFCFDPGHAALFSRLSLPEWAGAFGPALREIHVHDNRGRRDDHLPVGEGSIDFRGVLQAVADAGTPPVLTVEPHREEHFHPAVRSLRSLLSGIR